MHHIGPMTSVASKSVRSDPAFAVDSDALPPSGASATPPGAGAQRSVHALRDGLELEDEILPDGDAADSSIDSASLTTLIHGAGRGNPLAWKGLVARFDGMIAAIGRRYGLSPCDVNELQQTTWLRLVENVERIERPESVGGWLATTARRESLRLLNRAARFRLGADQLLDNMPDHQSPEVDARPLAEERSAALQAAWAKMKPRCRELLSLLLADDSTDYKTLSHLLDMPVGSIGPTRGRCLEHLRHLVADEEIINV